MNQYKIIVTYSSLDSDSNLINKTMPFVVTANSLEEARTLVQEAATVYINRVSGALISVE